MSLDQMPNDGQAETETAVPSRAGSVRLQERLEHICQEVAPDADAAVAHSDFNQAIAAPERGLNLAARRRELDRIGKQVAEHLMQSRLIAVKGAGRMLCLDRQLNVLRVRLRLYDFDRHTKQREQVDRRAFETHLT